jgi:hypothetical protein
MLILTIIVIALLIGGTKFMEWLLSNDDDSSNISDMRHCDRK